ncbi:MAG: DUF2207 domain-containing protein [Actinobacteria bacterium]|nr:DUF2207 domain-containing protein [Actinomycetota bacterium]
MRNPTRILTVLLSGLVAWLAMGTPAHAAETIDSYVVSATVEADGTLRVNATITLADPPDTLTQSFGTTARTTDSREYRFEIGEVTATSGGTPLTPTVTAGEGRTTVGVPTAGLTTPIELSYSVRGAAMAAADGSTVVAWPVVQGLELPVSTVDVTISVPGPFSSVDCAAGDPTAPGACTYFAGGTHDNPLPVFHHEGLAAGNMVAATLRFPAGAVAVNEDLRTLWTLDRAFSTGPAELLSALALLILGGLAVWLAHRRVGRDAAGAALPTRIAEFAPVGEGESEFRVLEAVRPGQVGTVLDEHVDPVDLTASVLDLAVRGHLRIHELERASAHAATDWSFERLDSDEPLAGYEQTLLEAIAPVGGSVTVSNLPATVLPSIPQVQSELYDEVVARGWFARRPDTTRNTWTRLGWAALGVALLVTILLAGFTTFGLVGLALVLVSLGVVFVAAEMPSRTSAGAGVLSGLQVLRGQLATQPTDQLPEGREYEQLSRILPYAVVLGGADRWLQALVDADDDDTADGTDLAWYHAGADWHLSDLPDAVHNFVTTVQGTLVSR